MKKYREQEGSFPIEGPNLILEALRSDFHVLYLFVIPEFRESKAFVPMKRHLQEKEIPVYEISDRDLKTISETKSPSGVLAVVQNPKYIFKKDLLQNWRRVVLLDHLREPGNLGTIIRSADWYGFDAVLLSKGSVESTNGKVLRATAGSFFHLPVFEDVSLEESVLNFIEAGFQVFAATGEGALAHNEIDFPERAALIIGNERQGVHAALLKEPVQTVRISRRGRGESLNAAMAATVLMDRIVFPGRGSLE
ncbi:MAG: RNA methyltransferase [Calditrichaeota bacterium]|nr:RNA methyltransferase [Calditrichota bacterium]